MRFTRPWIIVRWLFPEALFRIDTGEKVCCLTFDDGPDPESTPVLLTLLDKYEIRAMFFCSGKAAAEHPELMSRIRERGHLTGNHGYHHPDGWKTPPEEYFADIGSSAPLTSQKFFRPPYGRMTFKEYNYLKKKYRIIMWDLMPYDFDNKLGDSRSVDILRRKLRPGSVIVLHDIPGASAGITGQFIEYARSAGFRFVLPD